MGGAGPEHRQDVLTVLRCLSHRILESEVWGYLAGGELALWASSVFSLKFSPLLNVQFEGSRCACVTAVMSWDFIARRCFFMDGGMANEVLEILPQSVRRRWCVPLISGLQFCILLKHRGKETSKIRRSCTSHRRLTREFIRGGSPSSLVQSQEGHYTYDP